MPDSATLNLNNLPLYARGATIDGTVLNGTVGVAASLGGYVYLDANRNGTMDGDETGLSGVTLSLYLLADETYSPVSTTTTSDSGSYSFTPLAAGTYRIVETQPSGYINIAADAGTAGGTVVSANEISDIALGNGVEGSGYNFGDMPDTARPPSGSTR